MDDLMIRLRYVGMLLVILAIGFFLAVRPAYRQRAALLQQARDLEARVAQEPMDRRARQLAIERLASLQWRLAHETKAIPESTDVAGTIRGLSTDLEELALRDQRLNRGKETTDAAAPSIGLQVEAVGAFDNVVKLLRRVERLPRLVRISELTVDARDAALGEVKAAIVLDAFYRIPMATPAGPTSPATAGSPTASVSTD